jgi:hypothetical protein
MVVHRRFYSCWPSAQPRGPFCREAFARRATLPVSASARATWTGSYRTAAEVEPRRLATALQRPEPDRGDRGPAWPHGRHRVRQTSAARRVRSSERESGGDAQRDRTNEEVAGIRRPLRASSVGCGREEFKSRSATKRKGRAGSDNAALEILVAGACNRRYLLACAG